MEAFFIDPVIQNHIKAARHRNHKLVQTLMGMGAAIRPAGHIVKVVDPFDIKRDVVHPFDKCQVAAGIFDLGQVDKFAVAEGQIRTPVL